MGTAFSGGLSDVVGGTFNSAGVAVSNGGSVVVGNGNNGGPFTGTRWTLAGGMHDLSTDSGFGTAGTAQGVSADGSVTAGSANSIPFSYTVAGGIAHPTLLAGHSTGAASAASSNGSVLVGHSTGATVDTRRAVMWTNGGAAVNLGAISGGSYSLATGVSGNGSAVSGYGTNAGGNVEAFRWTQSGGIVGLGDLPGGAVSSYAVGISGDGATVVGTSESSNGTEAFRWKNNVMTGLGDLAGGTFKSFANGVSQDGGVIVGIGSDAGGDKGIVWDAKHGMRNLQSVLLSEYGVDFTGWTLTGANGISPDATAIVGQGTDPLGNTQAFNAQINSRTNRFMSGETYNGFHTSHLGGFGTSVDILGGTAGGTAGTFKTLTIETKGAGAAIAPAEFGFASDIAVVSGIAGDTFVLELSYDEATAISLFGSEAAALLGWYDPATQEWKNAVFGDTGGTASFAGDRAYNPATDTLGSFGVDTANNEVWAVLNHNSEFGVTMVPEPTSAVLLLGGGTLLALRRRRSPAGA